MSETDNSASAMETPEVDWKARCESLEAIMQNRGNFGPINLEINSTEGSGESIGDPNDNESDVYQQLMNKLKVPEGDFTPMDDEIANALADVEHTADLGPDLQEPIASAFIKTVSRPLSKETADKLKKTLVVPANCKKLLPPRMNQEIWSFLPTRARLTDLRMQQIQTSISHGVVTLAKLSNEVAKLAGVLPKETVSTLLKLSVDAANLMGNQLQDINQKRRLDVRPFLSPEVSSICSGTFDVSETLFGENLNEKLKVQKAASSIIRNSFSSRNRFRPYPLAQVQASQNPLNLTRPFQHQSRGRWNVTPSKNRHTFRPQFGSNQTWGNPNWNNRNWTNQNPQYKPTFQKRQ